MSEIKHTPGPWMAKPSKWKDGELIVQAGQPTNHVLARFGSEDEPLNDTDLANARLIAASPDLLSALESAIHTAQFEQHPQRSWHHEARAAIAKATGE